MRAISFIHLILLGTLASQAAQAVHPLPPVPNNCLYLAANPHRPDPAPLVPFSTPEQRCQQADWFALANVPTTPVGVIVPSGEPRYYCTLDGTTLASPVAVAHDNPALAKTLAGATPCSGDAICTGLFGADATCEVFGPDASGRSENGWTSMGPASSFAIASDLDGDPGAHSIYVRSENGVGHIFYFTTGANRTHSLTAPGSQSPSDGDLPILDITFCKAASSPVAQRGRVNGCTGFCPPVPCCGAHFPCAGAPDFPPLVQEPEERLAGLDLQLQALVNSGGLNQGQANGMQQRITNILRSLERGNLNQACTHMNQLILSIDHNINNGSLNPGAASPLQAEAIAVRDALGCS